MKFKTLLIPIFSICVFSLQAQKKTNTAFAVVSSENGKMEWMTIREIDLSNGQTIRTIFDKAQTHYSLVNAVTNKNIPPLEIKINGRKSVAPQYPIATIVAAAAFDKRHNKLFFVPMMIGDLRWVDLYQKEGLLKVYSLPDQLPSFSDLRNEANHITRMVIGADEHGYALSNDAKSFYRFSTGRKTVVTKMGALKDDPGNQNESIHNRKNWGGDMIADAAGNLYVIGANQAVFKIDTRRNMATYLGAIKGLPQNYTTNGAAVDNNGNLVVSSAIFMLGYYKINLSTLLAERLQTTDPVPGCSDLASGNLAFERRFQEAPLIVNKGVDPFLLQKRISFYPNPVTQGNFRVKFAGGEPGQHTIQVIDISGRVLSQKRVNISMSRQTEEIRMNTKFNNGTYVIRVLNGSNKEVRSGKLVFE